MIDNGDRYPPPGQHGVHGGGDQPGSKQVPALGLLPELTLRSKETGNTGKIDPAEGNRQDRGPPHAPETQVAKQVGEGKIRRAVVEDLKSNQCGDDQKSKSDSLPDLNTFGNEWNTVGGHDVPPCLEHVFCCSIIEHVFGFVKRYIWVVDG